MMNLSRRFICRAGIFILLMVISPAVRGAESFETAPVRPEGGDYVAPPFSAVVLEKGAATCQARRYDLAGAVPRPTVAGRPLLQRAEFILNGQALSSPSGPTWILKTPAVAIAERTWTQGAVRISLRETVEYDGFITSDLSLAPAGAPTAIRDLALRLEYRPDAATLCQIPAYSTTPAGFWPKEKKIEDPIVGIWGGNDHAGFTTYVATFRNWRSTGPRVILSHEADGPGAILYRIVTEATELKAPVTYRFGFIATPVRAPEKRHWQLFSLPPGKDDTDRSVSRVLIWGGLSDRYATFRTNKPEGDEAKISQVKEIKEKGKSALAYTTYAHVEEGAVEAPHVWDLATPEGKRVAASIGGSMADRNRVYCCPGSREWIEWKMDDLKFAVERYGVDGFYVDTSYVIMSCANAGHGHGWVDAQGQRQPDFITWSMREIWRRSYEMLCQARGKAEIYAHHKGGCPPALAAFTTAFCDGEQYCGQTIKNLTLDAFRAQISGRNIGPLALFLCEYYRSAHYNRQKQSEHHNPTESAMLPLLHDVLPTGYPGSHPVRELVQLRDDIGVADATWIPYYAPDTPWHIEGAKGVGVSAYRTARGDSVLIVGNPTYEDARVRLTGPAEDTAGHMFAAIDVLSRIGRISPATPGYRWEEAKPENLAIPARSFRVFAFVRQPETLPAFAKQRGFATSETARRRRTPIPEGATLVDDFEDPDWTLANDDGEMTATNQGPVDTVRALRVLARPQHDSAALLRTYALPQNWSGYSAISFWIRPDRPLPVRALDVRLRDKQRYGPPLKLVSHEVSAALPAGKWTELRYEFGDVPRNLVEILRIYYDRRNLLSGSFDLDEMMLHASGAPKHDDGNVKPGGADKHKIPD